MSSLMERVFNWGSATSDKVTSSELPELFPLPVALASFIEADVITIYSKILTDTIERTHGLSDEENQLMWDNCVKSSTSDGLISLLSKAMAKKSDLYIVYDRAIGVVRTATSEEQAAIQADYSKSAKSSKGVYVSFKNYRRSDMVALYSALEYSTIGALNKTMNVSAAVQLKISKLRESVSLTDSEKAEAQGQVIATALLNQRPIMIDGDDTVETASPQIEPTEKAFQVIAEKRGFYLGMPASYITSEQTAGIGSTGEADTKAVERGLKNYFFSIVKPVCDAVFSKKVTYKSQDVASIQAGLEVLKTFNITDDSLISAENKLKIINQVFNLGENAKGDPVPEPKPQPALPPPATPPGKDPRA